jgi:CheY-like chemotaxis protein
MSVIDRARGLTRQLLTFSKGGAPVKTVRPLFPFIRQTAEFALSGSNVSCVFDVAEDLWPCEYDENQMGQVIDNLVINAMQAMPRGGRLQISAENVAKGNARVKVLATREYVKIAVQDNGTGMPAKMLPFVFDPFYTTKQVGSGLGLTTCYSIVKRHEGHIDVESTPGQGTVFTIYLPAASTAATAERSGSTRPHAGRGRILIMDDEEVIRETTATMCESLGYTVVRSRDGHEALQALRDAVDAGQPFRAIILDLTVPGGPGGMDILPEIRKVAAELPVFVASGYADDPVMARPTSHGFTASICKPYRRQELAELFERHLPSGARAR